MSEKLYYTMGELAEMFDVNTSLIRYWEKQFGVLRPKRNNKGNRLFSPQDVENLKLIYHLVKERGMTLEGAKKALRGHTADSDVPREAELMERLQHIRSLLCEVREDLKAESGDILAEAPAGEPEPRRVKAKPVVKIAEPAAGAPAASEEKRPRRPRRKKGDDENKELFAFYEQSLF